MKVCYKCRVEKSLDLFPKINKSYCKTCRSDMVNKKYHALSLEEKKARNSSLSMKEAKLRYRAKPESKIKEAQQCHKWYINNKERKRVNSRLSKYKLSHNQYQEIKEKQNHICPICLKEPGPRKRNSSIDLFVIDHDHETGKVRGLLCSTCNTALGLFKDNITIIRNAVNYLDRAVTE